MTQHCALLAHGRTAIEKKLTMLLRLLPFGCGRIFVFEDMTLLVDDGEVRCHHQLLSARPFFGSTFGKTESCTTAWANTALKVFHQKKMHESQCLRYFQKYFATDWCHLLV